MELTNCFAQCNIIKCIIILSFLVTLPKDSKALTITISEFNPTFCTTQCIQGLQSYDSKCRVNCILNKENTTFDKGYFSFLLKNSKTEKFKPLLTLELPNECNENAKNATYRCRNFGQSFNVSTYVQGNVSYDEANIKCKFVITDKEPIYSSITSFSRKALTDHENEITESLTVNGRHASIDNCHFNLSEEYLDLQFNCSSSTNQCIIEMNINGTVTKGTNSVVYNERVLKETKIQVNFAACNLFRNVRSFNCTFRTGTKKGQSSNNKEVMIVLGTCLTAGLIVLIVFGYLLKKKGTICFTNNSKRNASGSEDGTLEMCLPQSHSATGLPNEKSPLRTSDTPDDDMPEYQMVTTSEMCLPPSQTANRLTHKISSLCTIDTSDDDMSNCHTGDTLEMSLPQSQTATRLHHEKPPLRTSVTTDDDISEYEVLAQRNSNASSVLGSNSTDSPISNVSGDSLNTTDSPQSNAPGDSQNDEPPYLKQLETLVNELAEKQFIRQIKKRKFKVNDIYNSNLQKVLKAILRRIMETRKDISEDDCIHINNLKLVYKEDVHTLIRIANKIMEPILSLEDFQHEQNVLFYIDILGNLFLGHMRKSTSNLFNKVSEKVTIKKKVPKTEDYYKKKLKSYGLLPCENFKEAPDEPTSLKTPGSSTVSENWKETIMKQLFSRLEGTKTDQFKLLELKQKVKQVISLIEEPNTDRYMFLELLKNVLLNYQSVSAQPDTASGISYPTPYEKGAKQIISMFEGTYEKMFKILESMLNDNAAERAVTIEQTSSTTNKLGNQLKESKREIDLSKIQKVVLGSKNRSVGTYGTLAPSIEHLDQRLDLLEMPCVNNNCHKDFVSVKEFTMDHLPLPFRSKDLYDLILLTSLLTVKVLVFLNSTYENNYVKANFKSYESASKDIRCGTGRVVHVETNFNNTSQKNCLCHKCKFSLAPQKVQGKIFICTSNSIIMDENDAKQSVCIFDYDNDDCDIVYLTGSGENEIKFTTDCTLIIYETCNLQLIKDLENRVNEYNNMYEKVQNAYKNTCNLNKLALIVSHPHGFPKHVSLGDKVYKETNVNNKYYYIYNTCACEGSIGAHVLILGTSTSSLFNQHIHVGKNSETELNFSSYNTVRSVSRILN